MSASRRLPNFSALRAFEAAARHENFSRAADELRLTHGAISHQVRALEEDIGRRLFVRHGRQVKITHEALQFAEFLGKTFDAIGNAADALRPDPAATDNAPLTLAAPAWFAARWLTPRLAGFIDQHPEIDLVLHTKTPPPDLARAGVEAAIVFDLGRHPGMVVERLMAEVRYAVVSTHYPARALDTLPATLQGGELLRAVLAGEGQALLHHVMAAPEIAAGRLTRRPGAAMPCAEAYYLVLAPATAERPQVLALRRWLYDEIAAFQRQQNIT